MSRRAESFYCSIVTQKSFVLSPWLIWSSALSNRTTSVRASQFGTGWILYNVNWQLLHMFFGEIIPGNRDTFKKQPPHLFWNTPLFYLKDDGLLPSSPVIQSSLALNSITEAKRSKNALVPKQRSLSWSVLRPEQAACISQNLCHNALLCAVCTLVTHFVIMIHDQSLFGNAFVSCEMFSADVIQEEGNSRLWGEIFPAKISLENHFGNVSLECYSLLLAKSVRETSRMTNNQQHPKQFH